MHSTRYLEDPVRVSTIIDFRSKLVRADRFPMPTGVKLNGSEPYQVIESTSEIYPVLSELVSIEHPNAREYKSFEAFDEERMRKKSKDLPVSIFKLAIIEEPCFETAACIGDIPVPIELLCETEGGELCILRALGVSQDDITFEIGRTLALVAPYMLLTINERCLLTDELVKKHIFPMRKKIKFCRYCGRENAERRCGECKIAMYCNRDCQKKDWKVLKHSLICKKPAAAGEMERFKDYMHSCNFVQDTTTVSERMRTIVKLRLRYDFIIAKLLREKRLIYRPITPDSFVEKRSIPADPRMINLKDMHCEDVNIDTCIKLRVIEEPICAHTTTHFRVEDEDKQVIILAVNPDVDNPTHNPKLGLGSTLLVYNPYMKVGWGDGDPLIRVDHVDTLRILDEYIVYPCHFCGKANANQKCKNEGCQKTYCNTNCVLRDNELQHDRLCGHVTMAQLILSYDESNVTYTFN